MLDQAFYQVYTKFKLHFYQKVFSRFENREATLTTVESFCMEGIMALGSPTIAQFAQVMHISTPNASYKINSLIKKGYVERCAPRPTGASITCAPPKSTWIITASATPTCRQIGRASCRERVCLYV